jgi:N-acetylglucosamine-6-phosphate deacetylase
VTASLDETLVALDRLAAAIETASARRRDGSLRAQPLGVHLEGPVLSHAKRGVHPTEHLLAPSLEVFERMWQAARGKISLMTVAPELPKAEYLIGEAARRGVCVSLGHSDSPLAPVEAAITAGARHATHTFNAMRALDHREPGILGAVLADERLTADIIADGIHVHPDVVRLFLRAKGEERAVLITDALSAAGMGDGRYRLGGFEFEVRGGRCEHDGRLAGSVLTLDCAVRNVMQFAHCGLQQAVRLATLNPARVAGFGARKGQLADGADADIVVLTHAGQPIQTFVAGVAVGEEN